MRVMLYAVERKRQNKKGQHKRSLDSLMSDVQWSWFVTLDIKADIHFWKDSARALHVIGSSISLGQALMLQEELNAKRAKLQISTVGVDEHEVAEHIDEQFMMLVKRMKRTLPLVAQMKIVRVNLHQPHHNLLQFEPQTLHMLSNQLRGRSILLEELMDLLSHINSVDLAWRTYLQWLYLNGEVQLTNGIGCSNNIDNNTSMTKHQRFIRRSVYRCRRCGSDGDALLWTYCVFCRAKCPYCEACLTMGRTRYCTLLIRSTKSKQKQILDVDSHSTSHSPNFNSRLQKWSLSPAQSDAVREGLAFMSARREQHDREPPCFLFYAVTGAGKTEMTFPLIAAELARGGMVALTTPRRDVVLELYPRIQKAFPDHKVTALYGGSKQRWEIGDIMLATTHQMMRFYHCFDLIIIDEVDAFPFKFNRMLETAVQQSCKPEGRYILLSATPPAHMHRAMDRGRLPHAKIPVRFHRHPLPVPRMITMKASANSSHSPSLSPALCREIAHSINGGKQIFLFVPLIKLVEPVLQKLCHTFPEYAMAGTSSQDQDRLYKVQAFRDGKYRLLVTTTILERGVTVPKTDVLIMHADSPIYDEAALVQMAGRSGRALSDPYGKVCFFAADRTRSQIKAIKQIKAMNRLALKRGYFADG